MLRTRILTTAVALPTVMAVIIFAPNWLFTWFIGALAAWGLYEVGAMTAARSLGRLVVLIAAGATPAGDLQTNDSGDTFAMVRDPWGIPLQLMRRRDPMI